MFRFFGNKKKEENKEKLLAHTLASRHIKIIQESIELMDKTVRAKTFFGRYEDALFNLEQVKQYLKGYDASEQMEMLETMIVEDNEKRIAQFMKRVHDAGYWQRELPEIIKHKELMTERNLAYLQSLR